MARMTRWIVCSAMLALLLGLLGSVRAADANGVIKSVAADKFEVVLTIGGRDYTFQVAPNVKVVVNKQPARLSDLKAGDPVVVSYAESAGKLVISAISRP